MYLRTLHVCNIYVQYIDNSTVFSAGVRWLLLDVAGPGQVSLSTRVRLCTDSLAHMNGRPAHETMHLHFPLRAVSWPSSWCSCRALAVGNVCGSRMDARDRPPICEDGGATHQGPQHRGQGSRAELSWVWSANPHEVFVSSLASRDSRTHHTHTGTRTYTTREEGQSTLHMKHWQIYTCCPPPSSCDHGPQQQQQSVSQYIFQYIFLLCTYETDRSLLVSLLFCPSCLCTSASLAFDTHLAEQDISAA